jgi:hypothetical protein
VAGIPGGAGSIPPAAGRRRCGLVDDEAGGYDAGIPEVVMKSWLMAEHAIRQAERRGDLENLPGKGQPLALDALAGLDEDARLDATLRKTTGGADLELDLRTEAARLRERLDDPTLDDATRATLKATLTDVVVRLSIVHEANGHRLLANSALDFMPG